ncbi:MAG TPA: PKD domain-containing protein [Candidatus Krumholzibacteria bacterium]|nr:PKD domain-containing protein [Candidatus Krumholzibacteria bacterium]
MTFMLTKPLRALVPLAALAFVALGGCSGQDGPGNLRDIEQAGGAVVAGSVHDTGGSAAEDAVVTLEAMVAGRAASVAARSGLGDDADPTKASRVRTAVADAAGRYAFGDLQAGDYLLTTSLRDHAGATDRVTITPEAAAKAETTVVDIQLMPTGTILGEATRENAADHSGTIVFVDGTSYVAVTDAMGAFSLTGVPIGTHPVHGTYPGYLDDVTDATLTAAGDSTAASALFLRLSANMPPVVDSISATTEMSGTPTTFGAAAHDPDGDVVLWEWDFENDGVFDWSSAGGAATQHVYPGAGQHLAKLRVTDDGGAWGLAVVSVEVLPLPTGAIFVSSGGDDGNPGSADQPVATLAQAFFLAQAAAYDSVMVAAGTYNETVTLVDGIGVFGGRDPVTWDETAAYSVMQGSAQAMLAQNITTATWIEGLDVRAADATTPAASSIGLKIINSGSDLVFHRCRFQSGHGGTGVAGTSGNAGALGSNGSSGLPGYCDQTVSRPGGNGGSGANPGGTGGFGGNQTGNGSGAGAGSSGGGGGGAGGSAGGTGDPGTSGGSGFAGAPGTNGNAGAATGSFGSLVANNWVPSSGGSGSIGQPGRGGGGGGGGGGQTGFFVIDGCGASGGGGGGGGYPGNPGTGGGGGGGSFGILLINSSAQFSNCWVTTGTGGTGGTGGVGGNGGNGGSGGPGGGRDCSDVGVGGGGGVGGRGGHGGGGAGGNGGMSMGIVTVSSPVPNLANFTFVIGSGGAPGSGGYSAGNPGSDGYTGLASTAASY